MAGRIPQEFLDQLLNRVDLVEVISARMPLRRAGHEFMACCPFHAEKTPSFSVSPRKQFTIASVAARMARRLAS